MKVLSLPLKAVCLAAALCLTSQYAMAQSFITNLANIVTNPAFTTSASKVGIGTTAPVAILDIRGVGPYGQGQIKSAYFAGTTGNSPSFGWFRARGTSALPEAGVNGDFLGIFTAYGYTDATNIQAAGVFGFKIDGAVSTGVMPTRFMVQTGSTTTTRATRLDISSTGLVTIYGLAGGAVAAKKLVIADNTGGLSTVSLAGVGSRMVVADANGVLSTTAISGNANGWLVAGNNTSTNVTGNAGVGDLAPAYKLTVKSAANTAGIINTDGTVKVGTGTFGTYGWLGTNSAHALGFGAGTVTPQAYLSTTGNFGVGTTATPPFKLTVQATGDGFCHTDGTTQMVSYVSAGYGWFGTKTVSPMYFGTSWNTYNGMRIGVNPTANGTITFGGNTDDTRAKITSHGVVGNTSALFRDSLSGGTGVSIQNGLGNWPGIGFNNY